ncbi:hypothetical protein BGZ57DRAFT_988294 [Hyaloscypha finlandica]|nr:hypothetical protein BGZ57DRAFT_988294 [Hyaloscypha finlandica]
MPCYEIIWPLDISSGNVNYDSYFSYYSEQCNLALYDGERHISAKSHQDIIEIAEQIRSHVDRKDITLWLSSRLPFPRLENEEERINGSIDLVVRLLCMINVGELQYGFSGQERLMWSENSLEHWIKNYFHAPRLLDNEHVKLEKIFSALNLGRIAGIEIQFTNNLADHLRLMGEDDKKVSIFHNASFLMVQRNNSMFPDGLIDETIRTLALLFPQSDPKTRKWFRKLSRTFNIDCQVVKCDRLRAIDRQINNFAFWRDRLVVLKQVFDEAEPSTLSQWWCDRRNEVQWYTFWVAILVLVLTLVFGLVQCIEGAVQIYTALRQ